jgi:hypothetical protein
MNVAVLDSDFWQTLTWGLTSCSFYLLGYNVVYDLKT